MKKTKIPSPLTAGAVIARRTITLGMGHTAEITITYDGPSEPAPSIGSQWPPERDWPSARLTLSLPRHVGYGGKVHEDLHCPAPVCGQRIDMTATDGWTDDTVGNRALRHIRRANASLRSIAAQLLREAQAELRPVRKHLAERAKRLLQRDATLNAGLDIAPLKG